MLIKFGYIISLCVSHSVSGPLRMCHSSYVPHSYISLRVCPTPCVSIDVCLAPYPTPYFIPCVSQICMRPSLISRSVSVPHRECPHSVCTSLLLSVLLHVSHSSYVLFHVSSSYLPLLVYIYTVIPHLVYFTLYFPLRVSHLYSRCGPTPSGPTLSMRFPPYASHLR